MYEQKSPTREQEIFVCGVDLTLSPLPQARGARSGGKSCMIRIGDKTMTNQELLNRITINPNMAFGKPTIRGLRYSVEWLLETLSSGMKVEEILADYEDLELADIQAVLLYAARLSQVKRMSMLC